MIFFIFLDHNAFFETRSQPQEKVWKKIKHLEAKDILLKNVWVNQEIKELKQFMETNENENT